jgi:hypothetical protein
MSHLPDGLIVIAKRDCPTCVLVEPLLARLTGPAGSLTVYSQDDPSYGAGVAGSVHDATLEHSYRLEVEIVPTLIRVAGGREVERTYGWHRGDWQRISGISDLGADLPEIRPGCGSKTLDPGIAETLALRFGNTRLKARQVTIGDAEDPVEACFARGWTDGLPVVPPTPERVLRMLAGTTPGARRGASAGAARPCALHGREGRHQRGDGRLPARVHAGGAGRGRGGADRRIRHARRAVHHHVLRPARDRERAPSAAALA